MSAHIQQAGLFSGRQFTFMVVVGLHAVVISALIAMRIDPDVFSGPRNIPISPIDTTKPPDHVPVDPKPRPFDSKSMPVPDLPVIPINIPIERDSVSTITVSESSVVPDAGGSTVATEGTVAVARSSTELRFSSVRSPDDYYPGTSVRLGEQGIATVQVCVDAAGRIAGKPAIQTSSGYKRLDGAAVLWASEALRFVPATVDGVAVASCKGFRVNFTLQ
jgi:TonB family protein